MSKPILIMFGGISPEHEVSIITGLQVVERIDREQYEPHVVYLTKQGEFNYLGSLNSRQDFNPDSGKPLTFGRDSSGGYVDIAGLLGKKIYPHAAYLCFHGGLGEGGGIQGMLEVCGIPHTATSQESSVLVMNKQLTKEQVAFAGVPTVPGLSVTSQAVRANSDQTAKHIEEALSLPVIIKPVHLGSSIGINVARTSVELEKYLLEAAFVDSEILVEKFLTGFTEYNCAVRLVGGKVEASEIERPLSHDEILSFADKYQRGGKKTGTGDGMASLQRDLPAQISPELRAQIRDTAIKAFIACRCKGMVRIDFMQDGEGNLFLTEINPIPGSMAFYLWEAAGIQFRQQISDLIEQAVQDATSTRSSVLDYKSDIVEKFVNA